MECCCAFPLRRYWSEYHMDDGTLAGALNNYRSFGKSAYYIPHVGDSFFRNQLLQPKVNKVEDLTYVDWLWISEKFMLSYMFCGSAHKLFWAIK
jgi:hypothetical protein